MCLNQDMNIKFWEMFGENGGEPLICINRQLLWSKFSMLILNICVLSLAVKISALFYKYIYTYITTFFSYSHIHVVFIIGVLRVQLGSSWLGQSID